MTPAEPALVAVTVLIVLAVVATGIRMWLRGRTAFLGMTAAIAGLLLGTGALGTFTSLVLVVDTARQAIPAHQRLFLRAGTGMAIEPLLVAGLAVLLLVPPNVVAARREPVPPHRWQLAARIVHAPLVLALAGLLVASVLFATRLQPTTGVVIGSLSAVGGIAGALAAAVFSAIVAVTGWGSRARRPDL